MTLAVAHTPNAALSQPYVPNLSTRPCLTGLLRGLRLKHVPSRLTQGSKSTMAELTHEQLVLLIAKNADRAAFKTLYLHYAPRLKSYLLNFKISDTKAEELAQETMITLWQKAAKFDAEKAKLSTWLFRVARNKFIDHTRKQKYPMLNADDHMAEMVAPEETDKPVEQAQDAHKIQIAMATLDPKLKAVIELSFYEELSHSAIAEKLDLPLGTVKSRIRKAFEMLRREIGDER